MLDKKTAAVNGICPYFTMFPLDFPYKVLKSRANRNDMILDPFCGRGTTNFAARLLNLESTGIDSSPVAASIAAAKLANTNPDEIVQLAKDILEQPNSLNIPEGEFWELAYHPVVLSDLCKFRTFFLKDCSTDAHQALRAIILGALHGPKQKLFPSYFSNQCTRTYAPKPAYSVKYWKKNNLVPENLDVLKIIDRRAKRYYATLPKGGGSIQLGDSRIREVFNQATLNQEYRWIITSPPYYGMRTYIPDQWLRHWFLGGPPLVDYTNKNQINHSSPEEFASELQCVWENAYQVASNDSKLIIRFGGISDRNTNARELIKLSLKDTGWKVQTICNAGTAHKGKRQADSFLKSKSKPVEEIDVWASIL